MTEERIAQCIEKVNACEAEIGKAIIGQKDVVRQVILAILTDGNVLLEGVPGLGKTQLVKTIAKVFDVQFSRIQFTPDLMPADVTGTTLIVKEDGQNKFSFQKGPVFSNIVLADEINRATPKTQAALLEAMQEKTVTVGGHTYEMPKPYMVLATQNPIENEGTYPLPEAQLDRFMFKIKVEFPSLSELKEIMDITVTNKKVTVEPKMTAEEILEVRDVIRDIKIADAVAEYALKIVCATHSSHELATEYTKKYILEGASPRAAQAIYNAARARAFLAGRLNVSFEDVRAVAHPALRHRIAPTFEALADGIDTDAIIDSIIGEIKE